MTVAEKEWLDAITALGCCVCLMTGLGATPAEPHHMIDGGRRLGHLFTIPLCYSHHRGGVNGKLVVSRHPHRTEFERRYGTEEQLLEWTKNKVDQMEALA